MPSEGVLAAPRNPPNEENNNDNNNERDAVRDELRSQGVPRDLAESLVRLATSGERSKETSALIAAQLADCGVAAGAIDNALARLGCEPHRSSGRGRGRGRGRGLGLGRGQVALRGLARGRGGLGRGLLGIGGSLPPSAGAGVVVGRGPAMLALRPVIHDTEPGNDDEQPEEVEEEKGDEDEDEDEDEDGATPALAHLSPASVPSPDGPPAPTDGPTPSLTAATEALAQRCSGVLRSHVRAGATQHSAFHNLVARMCWYPGTAVARPLASLLAGVGGEAGASVDESEVEMVRERTGLARSVCLDVLTLRRTIRELRKSMAYEEVLHCFARRLEIQETPVAPQPASGTTHKRKANQREDEGDNDNGEGIGDRPCKRQATGRTVCAGESAEEEGPSVGAPNNARKRHRDDQRAEGEQAEGTARKRPHHE